MQIEFSLVRCLCTRFLSALSTPFNLEECRFFFHKYFIYLNDSDAVEQTPAFVKSENVSIERILPLNGIEAIETIDLMEIPYQNNRIELRIFQGNKIIKMYFVCRQSMH